MCYIRHNTHKGDKMKRKTQAFKTIKKHFGIHYSFILLLLFGVLLGQIKLFLCYFLFLCLHELVHAFFAKKCGYKLGKIKLSASGAILEAEQDEFSFKDEILISISAPIFNLLVGLLFIAFWWIRPESYNFTLDLVVLNLTIFAYNILPIFPLDGGRVLLAYLSRNMQRKDAVKICKIITFVFGLLLCVLFIISLFFSPLYAFLIAGVNLEFCVMTKDKNAVYKKCFYLSRKLERARKNGVEEKRVFVHFQKTPISLLKLLESNKFITFVIIDDNFKVLKTISENEIQGLIESGKQSLL